MRHKHRFNAETFLRLALGIAILFLLVKIYDIRDWSALIEIRWGWLCLAWACSFLANIVGTARWKYALGRVTEQRFEFLELLHIFISGTLMGLAFVGGGMSIAYQSLFLKKRNKLPYADAAFSFALDRVMDPIVVVMLLSIASLYLTGTIPIDSLGVAYAVILVALGLLFTAGDFSLRPFFRYYLAMLTRAKKQFQKYRKRKGAKPTHDLMEGISSREISFQNVSPSIIGVLTLARFILFACRLHFVAIALNFQLPFSIILTGLVVYQVSWALALTPGGIGIAEWGWVGVLTFYGLPSNDGAMLAVSYRLSLVLMTLFSYSVVFICSWVAKNQPR